METLLDTIKKDIPDESAAAQTARIKLFNQYYEVHKETLGTRQDGYGLLFLKVIATLLSLGAGYLFGVWAVEGREFQREVSPILSHR